MINYHGTSEDEKSWGILRFLIPILAGIGTAGSLAGGAAGIATAVNKKKSEEAMLEEQKRHNSQMEKEAKNIASGSGLKCDIVNFI